MTKKLLLASIAFAFASTVPAHAAGPWSGIYIGGHTGGVWGDVDTTVVTENVDFYPGTPTAFDFSPSGVLAGAQLGYNHQMASWVFGLEVSGAFSDFDESRARNVSDIISVDSEWNASASLRAGFAFSHGGLAYVKGGYAMADLEHTALDSDATRTFTDSNTLGGYVLGVGYEHLLSSDVSFAVEYSYADYGEDTFSAVATGGGTGSATHDIEFKQQSVTARLNWHFYP